MMNCFKDCTWRAGQEFSPSRPIDHKWQNSLKSRFARSLATLILYLHLSKRKFSLNHL